MVSSNVDCRAVDVDVMARFNFEHVMCTDFEGDWKETAAGISRRIGKQASLHIVLPAAVASITAAFVHNELWYGGLTHEGGRR